MRPQTLPRFPWRHSVGLLLGWLGLSLVLSTCTDADPYRIVEVDIPVYDNTLKLNGKVCTTDPADVVFPLKVLFIIDTSQSMDTNDPVSTEEPDPIRQTGRARAVTEVVEQYINLKSKVVPTYCNTGVKGCEKGSTSCSACGEAGKFMCVGPDCCSGTVASCKGVPACEDPPATNGTCLPLCDVTKDGCKPGETQCPDCGPGEACLNGLCGNHLDPGVEFAIMRFGSAKQVLTKNRDGMEGFTNDIRELVASIPQISNAGSVTDYEGALSMAYSVISRDISAMLEKNTGAVSRTKYVVIFLSDGEPYPPVNDEDSWDTVPCYIQGELLGIGVEDPNNCKNDPALEAMRNGVQEYNIPNRILRRAKEIMALKALFHIGEITIHTSFLAANNPSWVEDKSVYLLKQIAQIGKGTFRSFPNGEDINFLHVGFSSLRRLFTLKSFIVSNVSAKPAGSSIVPDSDTDGLDDRVEVATGSSGGLHDTDGDGFSDTLEYFFRSSGWDPLDPADADCPLMNDVNGDGLPDDTDGDGLLDCEERFLGTSRNLFDSDADGIPDGIEVRFGTNPVVVDVSNDLDFDGMPNGDEMRLHTDPAADDAAHRSRTSYRYQVQKTGTGIETVGQACSVDSDCLSGSCKESVCRCGQDSDCASNASCDDKTPCTGAGESCVDGACVSQWTCRDKLPELKESGKVCAADKHIACYDYTVENITLATPKSAQLEGEDGWNLIELYMGEAPFDNPSDNGLFRMACVKAWYNDSNGSKLPPSGSLTVPQTAWKDPAEFNQTYEATSTDSGGGKLVACGAVDGGAVYCKAGDVCLNQGRRRCKVSVCVCPDGKVGSCH